jgi:hypothetical protein
MPACDHETLFRKKDELGNVSSIPLLNCENKGTKTVAQKERTVAQEDLPALGKAPEDRSHNFDERHPDG